MTHSKPLHTRTLLAVALALPVLSVSAAHAAVVASTVIGTSAYSQDSGIAPSLVTTGQASLQSVTASATPDLNFSLAGVNDGTAPGIANAPLAQSQATLTFFNNLPTPVSITFKLTGAYNITSVTSLAGWGDSFFGSQQFTVSFETGNSGTYTQVGGVFGQTPYTPTAPAGFPEVPSQDFSTKTTVSDNAATYLATNVTGIRLTYQDSYPTFSQFNGIVLREISVNGTAVPEASAALLGLLPLGALASRRRRSC